MTNYNLDMLKQTIRNSTEVAAAYLFGSAATGEPVVNDLDLLVFSALPQQVSRW
jgi:predicted nucleotidyltransferase